MTHSHCWQFIIVVQPGVLPGNTWVFPLGCLGFLTAWWLTSRNKRFKRQEIEDASVLRPGLRNWHCINSAAFYWSNKSQSPRGFKGRGAATPSLNGSHVKQFVTIVNLSHLECLRRISPQPSMNSMYSVKANGKSLAAGCRNHSSWGSLWF